MPGYKSMVFVLGFFVNFLFIMGSNQLFGCQPVIRNALLAASLGGLYGSLCLLPQLYFMGNPFCRMLCLFVIALIAFGYAADGIRCGMVYMALNLASGGVSPGMSGINAWTLFIASVFVLILAFLGLPTPLGGSRYVPVELSYGNKNLSLTALRDTGNHLRDPVTGRPVLVVGADTAQKLTGLSVEQLRQPVETMGVVPGLRLIPYKAIGGSGLLLALRIPDVRIGTWHGSSLVALSPEVLNAEGTYQALTGGML